MFGLGTIIDTLSIIAGGFIGLFFKKDISKKMQNSIMISIGLCIIFMGISSTIENLSSASNATLMIIISLVLGTLIGELLDIEEIFNNLGEKLKEKFGTNKDKDFIKGFLTASFTIAIGAMATIGAIKDGMQGDYSILIAKSIIDFVLVLIMTSAMGKGCIFAFIPTFILQGIVTILAKFLGSFLNDLAITNISLVGSMLIFCVGINLMFDKKIKVANMLPSLIIAIILAYLI